LYRHPINKAVVIAGLGFFVDAFDLLLFNVLRIPSLKDLGYSGADLMRNGEWLLSIQMAGMIVGGIISGVIGDRKGRVSVLFGSILLYSLANLANAGVTDLGTYALLRFLSGVGLAGELGAGISLVGESMSVEQRGYGTILVATLGAAGAVTAGLVGDLLPWRTTYLIAGSAGLLLLVLRASALESGIFRKTEQQRDVRKGSLRLLFSDPHRARRYVSFILIGVPVWYCVGMLVNLSPELAQQYGLEGVRPATCFILYQVGIMTGDLSSGILSQRWKTRRRVLLIYLSAAMLASAFYFLAVSVFRSTDLLRWAALLTGFGCGYLSIFVTTVSESFGTNLRVTATSTVTNFMRGAVTLLIPLRALLASVFSWSLIMSLAAVGILVFTSAFLSALRIPESYGRNLDYLER
jgi:MFS family permease